ncbi:MAG: hypothetical protein JWN08_1152 [Frankiales bacterium]|nr:hypothetical protein [Frankiales bacterium]
MLALRVQAPLEHRPVDHELALLAPLRLGARVDQQRSPAHRLHGLGRAEALQARAGDGEDGVQARGHVPEPALRH